MLILTRKKGEQLVISDNIVVSVLDVEGDKIKIGIDAPKNVEIIRKELLDSVKETNKQSANASLESMKELEEFLK